MKRLETLVTRALLEKYSNCCHPLHYKGMRVMAYLVDHDWIKMSKTALPDLFLTAGEKPVKLALAADSGEGDDDESEAT